MLLVFCRQFSAVEWNRVRGLPHGPPGLPAKPPHVAQGVSCAHETQEAGSLDRFPGPFETGATSLKTVGGVSHQAKSFSENISLHCTSVSEANPGARKIRKGRETMATAVHDPRSGGPRPNLQRKAASCGQKSRCEQVRRSQPLPVPGQPCD